MTVEEIEDEVLLVVLDRHPRHGLPACEAARAETDVVHDAAIDAVVAIAGLHEGFAKSPSGGLSARSLATRETSPGETKNRPSDSAHRLKRHEIQRLTS